MDGRISVKAFLRIAYNNLILNFKDDFRQVKTTDSHTHLTCLFMLLSSRRKKEEKEKQKLNTCKKSKMLIIPNFYTIVKRKIER